MANGELLRRTKLEIAEHGNLNRLSIAIGVNPGVIYRVLRGGNSPTLRRLWGIPKHPPLPRLIINNCPLELKTIYDEMCTEYGLTRPELLRDMMRVYNDTMENMPY